VRVRLPLRRCVKALRVECGLRRRVRLLRWRSVRWWRRVGRLCLLLTAIR